MCKCHLSSNDIYLKERSLRKRTIDDQHHLIDESDVIAEVKVIEVLDDRVIATVTYELVKQHKGMLDDNYLLLPTNNVEKGDSYMIFLQERGGELSLMTRNNSIRNLEDDHADDLLLSTYNILETN